MLVLAGALMGGEITAAVDEVRANGLPVISLNMAGSVPDAADLVVSDPVQAGVMAVRYRQVPHHVLIVADDMGYADIGVHGSKDIPTPNIDALAKAGVRFTDAYVTGPYCSPTRAGLLTGRYPQRFGHEFNLGLGRVGLPLSETTLADRLKAAGYRTAVFGKWHLGGGEKFHPMSRGFDEFFGFLGGEHSYLDTAAAASIRFSMGESR